MMWPLYQRLLPEQFTDWSEKRKMSRRRQSAARPRQPHLSRYRCALPRSNGIMCIWISGLPLSVRFVSAKLQNCELLPSVRITACTKATCTNIEEHIYVIISPAGWSCSPSTWFSGQNSWLWAGYKCSWTAYWAYLHMGAWWGLYAWEAESVSASYKGAWSEQ